VNVTDSILAPGVKIRGPIDPFFNYWDDDPKPTPSRMEPPRKPLDNLKSTNALLVLQSPSSSKPADSPKPNSTSKDKPDKEKKLVPPDLLPAFKAAVHGSELSKVGLIEVLSRQFMRQKVPKAAIKNSLELVAKRVGTKEADKRWVVEGQ
jgi:chromatin assembly factor 1 subunit A